MLLLYHQHLRITLVKCSARVNTCLHSNVAACMWFITLMCCRIRVSSRTKYAHTYIHNLMNVTVVQY